MKYVLALIFSAVASVAVAAIGNNHPPACTPDGNGVVAPDCKVTGGGNGPDGK